MLIRFKIGPRKYELDPNRLTLGELETLEAECGLEDAADLSPFKASQVRWFAFFAVTKAQPELTEDEAQTLARSVVSGDVFEDYMKQIQKAQAEAEKEAADPQVPAANATSAPTKASGNGNRASRQRTAGKPRSPASTA